MRRRAGAVPALARRLRFYRHAAQVALLCLLIPGVAGSALAQTSSGCEQAGRDAEVDFGLPPGLLLAIGRVESGRWDPALGRTAAWPWAIDVAGQPRWFDSRDDAVATTRALRGAGQQNIDVGCFQISLLHHPLAFADLAQAFDPRANAQYAARFLVALHARSGSWQDAVAAYHSADPQRGTPYRERVFASWNGAPAAPAAVDPVVVRYASVPTMQIWTPSPAGTAAGVVNVAASLALGAKQVPRVVTPHG